MPLKICFPFSDGMVGGSHISATTMLREMDPAQFEPEILLSGEPGDLSAMLDAEGIPYTRIGMPAPYSDNPFDIAANVKAARVHLKSRSFDYVHTNEGHLHVVWGLAAKLAGIPQIWHHRGHPRAKGLRFVAPLTAQAVVSVSHYASPEPSSYSAGDRCRVIHSPFDTSCADIDREECRVEALRELGLDTDSFLVGFFAQFGERKRPEKFVDAISAAIRQHPDSKIYGLLFGEEYEPGFEGKVRRSIERQGMQSRVLMMGFRKPAERWMAACDALLVPAVNEPFGRTLVEAMLVGTPVVAAASGGNIEAIDHGGTGLLAKADDAEDMAKRLVELESDPVLGKTIAANARAHALQRFGIDKHVHAIEELYLEMSA